MDSPAGKPAGLFRIHSGLGTYMLVRRELFGIWPDRYLTSAHSHAVMFGFVLFLIFGVALWLFPRPAKDDRRYSPARAAASYWILTTGTAARIVAARG
jgi:heme/copper-type cytochrome/quinol oxidase subunit 1